MKASFEIWMSRKNSVCNLDLDDPLPTDLKVVSHSPARNDSVSSSSQTPAGKVNVLVKEIVPSMDQRKSQELSQTSPVPFVLLLNKGNTCYINSLLQCLKNMPAFFHNCFSEGKNGQLLSAFNVIMSQMTTSLIPIDPSDFLKALQVVVRSAGNKAFNFNTQQDAAETLQHVIEDMSKDSPIAAACVSLATTTSITCSSCLLSTETETRSTFLQLPIHRSIQLAVTEYLKINEGEDFCVCCREMRPTLVERSIAETSTYLIIQLKRFCKGFGLAGKNCNLVECFPKQLVLPVGRDSEVKLNLTYDLIAMVNHEGP